tara:strand:- start:466 stop:981 length:516 start_codon:yes stop_codon:yes gene_type:complete
MTENWRWINMVTEGIEYDYTNMYRIYRDGKVEGIKRKGCKQNRFLKESTNKTGYKQVGLFKNNKAKNYLIHRLIACHFIPNPSNFPQVNHDNGVKHDNRIENLRWSSRSSNRTKKRKYDLPRGVSMTKSGKYQAQITINSKSNPLGCYHTIEEARIVYEEALRKRTNNKRT